MDLKNLYQKGFLVGPLETEEVFLKRVSQVNALLKDPRLLLTKISIPTNDFFIKVPSLICFRSSKQLPFWFGAMTWICQWDQNTQVPILQLSKKQKFKWLDEDDVITHELLHAKRAAFNEPQFEEILAYRTSKYAWRRNLGPLFQKQWESFFFLFSIILLVIAPLFSPEKTLILYFPALFFTLFTSFRLIKNQWIVSRALKHLRKTVSNPEIILEMLTDDEITKFALKKENEIDRTSLRWKQITLICDTY